MSDNYIEWRRHENIRPMELPNKAKFYMDLANIEHSLTGRSDIWAYANTFTLEAVQLIINAIELFEQGYVDCSFYSLRASIEIATTIVYFSDLGQDNRNEKMRDWKELKHFPMQGNMLKQLSELDAVFADMKEKMPCFFKGIKETSARINKFVHKQGLKHLYIARHLPYAPEFVDEFIFEFEKHLKECVSIIAVMRLAIDPFPILLMDEEILYRSFDSMTEPFSFTFVEEYIGKNTITAYKTTEIYQVAYEALIKEEKKTPAVFDVVKHQYIDNQKMNELLQQLYLMPKDDVMSVLIVYSCNKVVKVYSCGGLRMYFTDKNTNRKSISFSGSDFKKFADRKSVV